MFTDRDTTEQYPETSCLESNTCSHGASGRQVRVAVAPAPALDQLVWWARRYHRLGWRPVPLHLTFLPDGTKEPDYLGFMWADVRDKGITRGQLEKRFAQGGEEINALSLILEPGHVVLDTDSEEAEAILADFRIPTNTPVAKTRRGRHYHFRVDPELLAGAGDKLLLAPGLEVLTQRNAFSPPSPGYTWEVEPEGELPELPPALLAMVTLALGSAGKPAKAKAERAPAPAREAATAADPEALPEEARRWQALLPDLVPDGRTRYRARCPVHRDTVASFSVYPGQNDGRLIGKCQGKDCGRFFTLKELRRELRRGDVTQYRKAHDAITSLGEELRPEDRRALRWLVDQAQEHNLDLRDSGGIGASVRQLAKASGCEEIVGGEDGSPKNGGYHVRRLLARLGEVGVRVIPGRKRTKDDPGASTRLVLPDSWFQGKAS